MFAIFYIFMSVSFSRICGTMKGWESKVRCFRLKLSVDIAHVVLLKKSSREPDHSQHESTNIFPLVLNIPFAIVCVCEDVGWSSVWKCWVLRTICSSLSYWKKNLNLSFFVFISFVNFNRYFYISEKSTATRTWEKNVYSCSKVGTCIIVLF